MLARSKQVSFAQVLLILLCGCGAAAPEKPDKLAPVTGTVTLDGKPLGRAAISFIPDGPTKGIGGVGYTDDEGKFEATWREEKGVPPGTYKVVFSRLGLKDGSPVPPDKSAADVGAVETVPAKFSDPAQSQYLIQVPDAGLTQPFDLKSK